MNAQQQLFNLTPAMFSPHTLHGFNQNFRETNCYGDLIIELVYSLGLEPTACLAYTLAVDFEGDQWTFGKPSSHDLMQLYGIRIEELSLYRSLMDQMVTQIQRGSVPLLEADAYHLPDTAGIDYLVNHVKTTIAITHIDAENKSLRYFHNAAFSELNGDDFDGVLRPLIGAQKGYLPPYCELAKLEMLKVLSQDELRAIAFTSAKFHLKKRPRINPIEQHGLVMAEHQQNMISGGQAFYHAYTFVALRQLGAAHQLGAHFLRWLNAEDENLKAAANAFEQISTAAKMLVLKLARVSHSAKPADLTVIFAEMAAQYELASQHLGAAFA